MTHDEVTHEDGTNDKPVTADAPRSEPGHGTPEGYAAEKPDASEVGKPGRPGAVDEDSSAASVAHHDASTHMDAHTSIPDDDHGHPEAQLGPIDWVGWSYALLGAAAALIVVALFWVAVN